VRNDGRDGAVGLVLIVGAAAAIRHRRRATAQRKSARDDGVTSLMDTDDGVAVEHVSHEPSFTASVPCDPRFDRAPHPRLYRRAMPLPLGFIAPCLPTKAPQPPTGGAWLHEIKHDGFRVIARKDGARVKLYSRPGNDLSDRFLLIVEALARLRSRSCIIDECTTSARRDRGVAAFKRGSSRARSHSQPALFSPRLRASSETARFT
jgi:hypothetical protein